MTFTKRHILHLLIAIVAYGFLGYKLLTFEQWDSLVSRFQSADGLQYLCLLGAVLLFPVNMLLEACKWQQLLRGIESVSLSAAQRQVYAGAAGAFITPYRVGDFPTRATLLKDTSQWLIATVMGLIGSVFLTSVIVLVAFPSAISWFFHQHIGWQYVVALVFSLLVLVCLPYLVRLLPHQWEKNEKMRLLFERLRGMNIREVWVLFFWSMLRYLCFSLQLWFVLRFVGVDLSVSEAVFSIPLYYLLVTLTPNAPVIDPAIRGSWAVVVFGAYTAYPPVTMLAALLVWTINTVFPMLVGTITMRK